MKKFKLNKAKYDEINNNINNILLEDNKLYIISEFESEVIFERNIWGNYKIMYNCT